MATKKDVYENLKRQMPSCIEDLEASINLGFSPEEVFRKMQEKTVVAVPEIVWGAIRVALDYMAVKRDLLHSQN